MHESSPASSTEIDAIRAAYAALNRGDVAGFVGMLDRDIERVEVFSGGVYRGLEAVTAHVVAGRSTWAEGACEPTRFLVAGNRVLVWVEVRVRLKTETDFRRGLVVDVYTFRDGKAVEFRSFGTEPEALAWAGVAPAGDGVA